MSPYFRLYLFEQSRSDPAMPSLFERSAKPTEYREALAKDMPIGSGEIEGAHYYIAQQRLKLAELGGARITPTTSSRSTSPARRLARLLGHTQQEWANRGTLDRTLYGATNLTWLA